VYEIISSKGACIVMVEIVLRISDYISKDLYYYQITSSEGLVL
jgi:hypothetical protein